MKIAIIGTGYVGLVTGACFSGMGAWVTCVDIDQEKIENLKKGILPIYEPGLETLVSRNYKEGTLRFATNLKESAGDYQVFFIAVGTPPGEDGSADLRYVLAVAKEIGSVLEDYAVIVDKSTVPVGTADKVRETIQKELDRRGVDIKFDVVSNPEFLKEGAAVNDFMKPDRIVVGADSGKAEKIMKRLYAPFSKNREKLILMNVRDAEMTKYAANSMLATKISFMNEIANLCEALGVDVENVRKGIGSDSRIGYSFIYPGCGYGGSCFPKDVKALIEMNKGKGVRPEFLPTLLEAVEERNHQQKKVLWKKIMKCFSGNLQHMVFGIWGLAFKPGTDDVREAPSLTLVRKLLREGARVQVFDPKAMKNFRKELYPNLLERVFFCEDHYKAIKDVDALVLVTEWKNFRQPDFKKMIQLMARPIIFDGRNQYDLEVVREHGFEYHGIGREPNAIGLAKIER